MTLQSNEVVYQADQMAISPSVDSQINGYKGDWILGGLQVKSIGGTAITITAGRAIVQGRLIELKTDTTYNFTGTGTVYFGVKGDLSQSNAINSDGSTVNNQYTFGVFTSTYGNLLNGDVETVIGLYSIAIGVTTTTSALVKPYFEYANLTYQARFTGYSSQEPFAVRNGNTVTIYGALTTVSDTNFGGGWGAFNIPQSMRPTKGQVRYVQQGSGMNTFLIELGADGWGTLSRYGTTTAITTPKGAWLNIGHTFILQP